MRRIEFLAAQATSIPTSWAFGTSSAEADPIILAQTLILKGRECGVHTPLRDVYTAQIPAGGRMYRIGVASYNRTGMLLVSLSPAGTQLHS